MVGIERSAQVAASYPHHLSGGMRQRVMIAIAMSCEPDLLIADEPTTALDVTTQAQILDLILQLQESHGTAVLLVTHDLGVVAEACQRVAVMRHGRILETGGVREIFHAPQHPYTRALLESMPARNAGGSGACPPCPRRCSDERSAERPWTGQGVFAARWTSG